jgi:hypothetical protein
MGRGNLVKILFQCPLGWDCSFWCGCKIVVVLVWGVCILGAVGAVNNQNERRKVKLNSIGKNQTEIEGKDGRTVLYSYNTPVAVFVPGVGALVTDTKWSVTTSKHVNAAGRRWGVLKCKEVSQAEIERIAGGGEVLSVKEQAAFDRAGCTGLGAVRANGGGK